MKAIQRNNMKPHKPATAGGPAAMPDRFMKLGMFLLSLAMVVCASTPARSQTMVTDTGAPASSFMAPLSMPGLQPFWVGYVGADKGLGFQGQYFSAGGLVPITTDQLDGVWFVDARGHVAVEQANFFSNIGIGRRVYFDPADAIIGVSGWYDYDGDAYQNYGYRYNQLGVTAEVFNPLADFRFNGYFPVGANSHVLNQFTQNYLLYVNGIDTALHGGDAKFSIRPPALGAVNGYIDIGGYIYKSPVVDSFGGVSTGFGVQPLPGLAVNMEVNHDNFFGTTGFIRVAFGLRGSPGNSRTSTRILEPTRRNDHIVRFNQQPQIATNPETSAYYHVLHVDNNAPAGGDGTAERPFNSLAAAQAASVTHDMIYVHTGDGTARNYNQGIILKDNQMLFGSGSQYVVQTTEIGPFLMKALDSVGPVITNPAGGAVVLANGDRVGGMTISGAQVGILGTDIINTSLETNRIIESGVDGIRLVNFQGTAHIRNNITSDSKINGMHFIGGTNPNTFYEILGNVAEGNVFNGVFFDDAHGGAGIYENQLGSNGRGNWGGLNVQQRSGVFEVDVTGNRVENNTEGMIFESFNPGTYLQAQIHDNPLIRYNKGDGIQVSARNGATTNYAILNNPVISYNGQSTGGGAGIRLYSFDAIMNGTINSNILTDNAGNSNTVEGAIDQAAGIQGLFEGDSITALNMTSNVIDGYGRQVTATPPYGSNILLEWDTTNFVVQTFNFTNNQSVNSSGAGLILASGSNLLATVDNNLLANNWGAGLDAVQAGFNSSMRLIATNNIITGNVSPNNPAVSNFGSDGGVTLQSAGGNMWATISNNVIDKNGIFRASGAGPDVSGIRARTVGSGTMGLEILGNEINNNANRGINLTALDGFTNFGQQVSTVTMGVIVRDNMIQGNKGDVALNALTPSQAPPRGPNLSFIAVEVTHNQASQRYNFRNEQQPPDTAIIAYADGGLNNGLFTQEGNTTSLGTVFQTTVANIDALIAPLLVFP